MFTWKTQVRTILAGLARTHARAPLSEIATILSAVLGVERVDFRDANGQELPVDLPLRDALDRSCRVNVDLELGRLASRTGTGDAGLASRFREGPSAIETQDISEDERYDLFLSEFLRLEQHHEFMWAGYIVRELLPQLGFAPEEAKLVLDRLRTENLVTVSKVPNPKNPDFPATGVHLNHDHPRVKALIEGRPAPAAPAEQPADEQVSS
ncbi:MAG: hypothetical protein PVJ57_07500 [Phycisphaerae bacterium]|jgi:hypothetical protein